MNFVMSEQLATKTKEFDDLKKKSTQDLEIAQKSF